MRIFNRNGLAALLASGLLISSSVFASIDAKDIVERSDKQMRGDSSYSELTMNIKLVIDNEYIIKNLHYNHIILLYKAKKPDYLTLLFK